jgi:hypothetical protein
MPRCFRLAGLALVIALGACTTWAMESIPAPPAPMRSMRGPVRVTVAGQGAIEMVNVVVATDSLFGRSADVALVRYAFPLRDVTRIEEKKKNALLTVIACGAVVAALLLA